MSDEDEQMHVLDKLREEFEMADEEALCNEENWWAVILEQMEMGRETTNNALTNFLVL